MGRDFKRAALASLAMAVCSLWSAGETVNATEGYFQHGFGARHQALGGAGVSEAHDAMMLSHNPAAIVQVGHQFQAGLSLFAPFREYTAIGPGFVAPGGTSGTVESSKNYFVIPNVAYSRPIDAQSAWGLAVFGNGGMNTTYRNIFNSNCPAPGPGGVFCGGNAGVDLMQAFITVGYARSFGPVSVGVAPVIAVQRFKADGLAVFSPLSSDPANLTNRGYDYSVGAGVRAGLQWSVAPNFRVGVSGQTPIWMTEFDKYRGLFADQGDFDIPGNLTVGFGFDINPALTFMFDYKRVWYGKVGSVGNSSSIPLPFGSSGGPGFGWRDANFYHFGLEWRASPLWTFRLGYAHNDNPIRPSDVTLNILAPGVVTDHFTGGFSYKVTPNSTIDFAAAYMPSNSVTGVEVTPLGPNPFRTITLEMYQYQFTIGWTYQFDSPQPAKPVVVKH